MTLYDLCKSGFLFIEHCSQKSCFLVFSHKKIREFSHFIILRNRCVFVKISRNLYTRYFAKSEYQSIAKGLEFVLKFCVLRHRYQYFLAILIKTRVILYVW